jgi:hypothetical protein
MKRSAVILLSLVAVIFIFAGKIITSGIYDWDSLRVEKTHNGYERDILKGPTQTLESFEIKALTLHPGKESHTYLVDKGCDELLIIKEGSATYQ